LDRRVHLRPRKGYGALAYTREDIVAQELNEEEKSAIGSKLAALGGSLGKVALIVVVVVISSIGGGVVSWVLIVQTGMLPQTAGSHDPENADIREMMENGAVVGLDPFVVNLADTDAPRYLRVTISLLVDDRNEVEEVVENATMLSKTRDVILKTLSRKRSDEIIDEEGKNHLRTEILERLEPYYEEPRIVDVMFTEFVIQL
jgi:flagellar FliL protein